MREEHRLEPNGGFKAVLAVITAAHLLVLGAFLTLSLHPLKRMNRERMDNELVWVNPGSFGGDVPGKADVAPAVSAAPSAPPLPATGSEPQPDVAPAAAPTEPEEASASVPAPAAVEPLQGPVTPPPLPPLPAPSGITLATPSPSQSTPAPAPKPSPVPTPIPTRKPVSKPKPKPSPSATSRPKSTPNAAARSTPNPGATPKARATPRPSPKPKPSPKPAPEASPESPPNPKPTAGRKAALLAKNGEKAPHAARVVNDDGGETAGSAASGTGDGTGSGQATGNGENKLAYYAEVIKNRFQAAWNQPHGEIAAGTRLVATVRLRIQPDGTVTDFTLIEGSGSSVVDESVREAGRKITHLPSPPGGNAFNPVVRFELGD